MVKPNVFLASVLVFAVLLAPIFCGSPVNAQSIVYSIDHQWTQIFINQDGTIDLTYNLTLSVSSGTAHSVDIGQPKADFTPSQAVDQYGNTLQTKDDSQGGNYQVLVTLKNPLTAGNTVWFSVTTNVAGMITNDTTNPGNYGMQFTPEWMGVPINDVRVQIVLPPGATVADVKTPSDAFYQGTSTVEGRLAVYWEKPVLGANEKWNLGVSFPAKYMPNYNPQPSKGGFSFDALTGLIVLGGVVALLVAIFAISLARKSTYSSPKVSMETLGIKRGLTAPEASYLLELKPTQIVTEILYSLLKKRAVWAQQAKPLKLQIQPPYENKTGTTENPLHYYEIDFLNAIKADGVLDEQKLADAVVFLEKTVEEKMQGFSRKDTVDYYRRIVAEAWSQVTAAGTVELASNAYDEQLLWLMMDPNQRAKTESAFQNRTFNPDPLWFWWWYGYSTYHPHPTYQPNSQVPAQSGKPPAIPGADFANNIATAVEGTANNVVVNLEKFANAIVPPPPKTSHEPANSKADCVCACHACACACACVSCACACAGGGVH
jgi:hypothetical protein